MSQGYGQGYGQGASGQGQGPAYAPTGGAFGPASASAPGWGPAQAPTADPQRGASVAKIALGMLITGVIVLLLRLINRIIGLFALIGAGTAVNMDADDPSPVLVVAGLGGIVILVLSIVGLLVVIANTILSIIAAVQGSGKARIAGIVSALLPLLGFVLGLILGLIVGIIGAGIASDGIMPLWVNFVGLASETLVTLLVGGGLILCALAVRGWARSQA